jgi:hypothetical protein
MRWRLSLLGFSCLIVLAVTSSPCARAQNAPDIFVTPIPKSPFSATVLLEWSGNQSNDSPANLKSIREIGRDSGGRIHNESRTRVPASSDDEPQIERIHLYDPQTRISTMLNPETHTFWTTTVNHPPATVPPAFKFASADGQSVPQNEFTKQEDLGTREVDGVQAHGMRYSQTIPSQNAADEKDIVVTDEYWYSADLRINLVIVHNDPRQGTVSATVSNIKRTEPDPDFFEVPEGYSTPRNRTQKADQ